MRNFQLLDSVEDDAGTGILTFTSADDAGSSPRLALRREGDFLGLSASYGALELALRLHHDDVARAVGRLRPVAGLQTSRTVGTGQSSLALGAQPDGSLLMRVMLFGDATGHLSLNLELSADASQALRRWLGAAE